MSTLNVHNIDY